MSREKENPLVILYGESVFDTVSIKIQNLVQNSNFIFDSEYVSLGTSFMMVKAQEIIDHKKPMRTLGNLISESFGEAAICKFN